MLFNAFIQPNTHSILQILKQSLYAIQSITLPAACVLCGSGTHQHQTANLCDTCHNSLPILPHHCPQCARFLPISTHPHTICGACLKESPPFDRTFALFPYQPPIISLIAQMKFHQQLSHAYLFGTLLSRQIQDWWYAQNRLPDLILPVPLHETRLRERGFNQAYEIAKPIAATLGIPIDIQGSCRHKPTSPQSGLPAHRRKTNIRHAFSVRTRYDNLHLAVIDDVVTTGQTMREFCHALKQHGASKIDVWCCARRG